MFGQNPKIIKNRQSMPTIIITETKCIGFLAVGVLYYYLTIQYH